MDNERTIPIRESIVQSWLNYATFGSFPKGCTFQELNWLINETVADVKASGEEIVAVDANPDDVIPDAPIEAGP